MKCARRQTLPVAPITVECRYRRLVTLYLTSGGDHGLREITPAPIDGFEAHLHARDLSPVTINMHLTHMATFLN